MVKRQNMVKTQIEGRGVIDRNVLSAMRKVEQHLFVPERSKDLAYEDYPLAIGHGQTISQPFIVAYMTEALKLKGDEKVLEIGTGSGYQAAVLAELAAEIYTIEIVEHLAETAQKRLKTLGYDNITVRYGDGYKGWSEQAPFDAIIITAAPKEIPQKLIEQLKVGGKMIVPVGGFSQQLICLLKTEEGVEETKLIPVRFVPMIKGHEVSE